MTLLSLKNLPILITRPKNQTGELVQRIVEKGGLPLLFPTLAINPIPTSHLAEVLQETDDCDLVIFISQNAVLYAASYIANAPKFKIATIGPATAKALQDRGIHVDFFPSNQFDSEHLLALPFFKNISHKKVIILGGEGGRPWLEETLKLKGAVVKKIAVYYRSCPKIPMKTILNATAIKQCVIVTTSGESIENLFKIMSRYEQKDWLLKQSLLIVSVRLRDLAMKLGFPSQQLLISSNATTPAILDCLIKWYAKQQHTRNMAF